MGNGVSAFYKEIKDGVLGSSLLREFRYVVFFGEWPWGHLSESPRLDFHIACCSHQPHLVFWGRAWGMHFNRAGSCDPCTHCVRSTGLE